MKQESKLSVLIRVEPGSLGPDGLEQVEKFCLLCQRIFNDNGNLFWQVEPRYDKSLPEISYFVNGMMLNDDKARRLFSAHALDCDEIEEQAMDEISKLIDRFLGHEYK